MMNVPAFIEISPEKRAEELRAYFHGLGAEIALENSGKGLDDDLHKIIGVCDVSFKAEEEEGSVESVLNGILSLLSLGSPEKSKNLILSFCDKLNKADERAGSTCLKVLWSLYEALPTSCSPMRICVYLHVLSLADRVGAIQTVYTSIEDFKSQFAEANDQQLQELLRLLHQALLNAQKSDEASQVMVELLRTYTMDNASQAREEAQRCIIASLADPHTFLLDHLLQLTPVKFLEGEVIHDLLKIFVFEKLDAYENFYKNHKEFVTSLGLKHENNLSKMKLLTFMQLAETQTELSFHEIQTHLNLNEDEVELFVIDLLKTKLVRAKLDQANKVVHVSSTMHRTFTKQHWNKLHSLLNGWKTNLHTIRGQLSHWAEAQLEMKEKQI
ncbi:eukaryotic translation initiation factor 3 subunit M [Lepeophtheirus salmonis]|uniref:Eukaryotic translation initiation factor 3 subunit M n=2 Tax=Lepeophtheirus salmonis TaxID=72036 RepID=D3PGY5_LEPSM|nr:eukaryotic translation initiation factor 3 subunit M-like [Lepeophtheirus salmonis]ADD24531.1 Eukaryotic translation initiation factor 3 subunit M [Lepeophtheirus salmonis]